MKSDLQIELINPTVEQVNKLTKLQLIELIMSMAVQSYELVDMVTKKVRDARTAEERLGKAEAYVEQGRSMIESVMERWHHYDD